METVQSRIMERIDTLAAINDTPGVGVTRFSYGEKDAQARAWLFGEFERIGLKYSVDAVGNIRARYDGADNALAPVWFGSHIDSVRNGGKFDGIVGSVSALEVLTVLHENGVRTKRPLELIYFAEEEGSNFGTTMIGSKALVGKCDCTYLRELKTEDGTTAYDLMKQFGLDPDRLSDYILKPEEVHAMVELHIEQGAVLEYEKKSIGVVEAIVGMQTYQVVVNGRADHAGSTPMNMRKDPMVAAAKLICEIQAFARYGVRDTTVATVGRIECRPNAANVIPQTVEFSIDIRDICEEGIEKVVAFVRDRIRSVEQSDGVSIGMYPIGTSSCVRLDAGVVDTIEACVKNMGVPYLRMNSGAVHDSAMLAKVTRVGMIFVPSRDGKSHAPEEYTAIEDIKLGADLLLDTIVRLANESEWRNRKA